ncbi:MAG: hypothetical protein QIT40_gp30 [Lokiarchaeia virus VerdaV4]|uniref:Uncharacterized protein n=1 Tax=Lokiarchaeia virus VerdaV4 TaxID=3070172 RepID=A0AA35CR05_9CAUD|nr:MAG: hypothetical protein QIT40_gp30 [Lokiarchaeia virus VerdaV4]BDI54988.1 MAG: hypothetical protein [Lokiarchaeia virus VerdaV4]
MSFNIKTEGHSHKFKKSSNELIIKCYDYNDYHIGNISIILNEKEKKELIKLLTEGRF